MWISCEWYIMRILLLDIKTSGHRIEYAGYLTQHFQDNEHEVYYYTCGTDDRLSQLEELGATVNTFHRVPTFESAKDIFTYQIGLFQYYRSAFKIADSWEADIVHQLYMERTEIPLLPTLIERRNSGWQFFGTYFAVQMSIDSERVSKQVFRYGQRLSIRILVKRGLIDGLFVHSKRLYDDVAAIISKDKNIISVVPDPIDPPAIKKTKTQAREELSLPKEDLVILFFGSARQNKGPDVLLESLSYLGDKSITVVFAGKAGHIDKTDIQNIRSTISSEIDIVDIFRFIPDKRIYTYFYAADAIALPYRTNYHGTSGILQRSIASERPVIGTDCGIVGSIINSWNAGITVEPNSPSGFARGIEEYIKNKEYYDKKVTRNAQKYINRHHKKELASQVLGTYEISD
jgi:glycosyltransferase involved in cell wall biosynthesis